MAFGIVMNHWTRRKKAAETRNRKEEITQRRNSGETIPCITVLGIWKKGTEEGRAIDTRLANNTDWPIEGMQYEVKITALIRLTHMNRRWGTEIGVPYSLERATFDVRELYLFPGFHEAR